MKQFILTITLFMGCYSMTLSAQSPGGVGGLTAWWSAIENNAKIEWRDHINESGFPAGCVDNPSMINYNPAFSFCPTMQLENIYLDQAALTIIAVAFPNNTTEQTVWSLTHEDASQYMLTNHRLADLNQNAYMNFTSTQKNQPFLYTYLGEVQPEENKTFASLFQIAQHSRADVPANSFSGIIPEIIIYDHILSPIERNKVESAIAIKYGLSISTFQSPNYLASDETIIWNGIVDKEFSHQIGGIGRDSQSNLYQKQSRSSAEGALLTIAANIKARTNNENTQVINDLSFLVWGSNDQVTELINQDEVVMPFAREWRINNTNFDSTLLTSVYFDLSATNTYIANNESFYLIIDRSGSGIYHVKDSEYYSIDKNSREVSLNNITWDSDGSGTDQFRLAIAPEFFGKHSIDEVACGELEKAKIYLGAEGGTPPYQFTLADSQGSMIQWKKQNSALELIEDIAAGLYFYTVVDAQGQIYTETITIENKSTARVDIIDEFTISENSTDILDPADYGFTSYTWISPDGFSQSNTPIQFSSPGNYTLLANIDNCVSIYNILVKREHSAPTIQLNAYPNPTPDGHFTATITCNNRSTIEYQLTAVDGKVIQQTMLAGRNKYILQGTLPGKGHYILSAKTREHTSSSSIIYQ